MFEWFGTIFSLGAPDLLTSVIYLYPDYWDPVLKYLVRKKPRPGITKADQG